MKGLLAFAIITLLLFSISVQAVGSSTRRDDTTASNNPASATAASAASCAPLTTLRERVKCRLASRDDSVEVAGSDESCANVPSPERCIALYKASARCYDLPTAERRDCFRNIVGLTNAAYRDQSDKESVRQYIILQLYELQERVEYRVESGALDAEDGAALIASIVEIKQSILNGATRAEVKQKIQDLRTQWREINE